jgi:hypothetical protein
MIANIVSDDALILPHHANPAGSNFRERQVFGATHNRSPGASPIDVMPLTITALTIAI